ncbi:MAG: amidohydrolase [Deltaproteobacteria bacterium]|jgi:predicted TIM-barrel fold metal-dependent hydrolase|nr:amidohydrolase [Deltaproteobacteria bacterium]
MLVDVHIHLSPPYLISDRLDYIRDEPGLEILYSDPKANLTGIDDLLRDLDQAGVDKALVMGFPYGYEERAKRHNDWLLEISSKYKGRLLPLAAFDPRAPWAFKHAEDFLNAGGFGLGELCVYDEGLSDLQIEALAALGQLCRVKNSVLLVHVNEPVGHQYPGKAPMEIGQIYRLVKRCQEVKLILAHFGGGLPLLATFKKEVRDFLSSVRFDTAAMPYLFEPLALRQGLDILGATSFVLGTDYPLLKTARYQKYFEKAGLRPEELKAINGQSAADFLGL